ncbi:MAG: hypothetical protein FJ096_08690 [Deltaproteobacteria bacterium]|nr:hypothetical protein [Deltaproteobacteria bacterium]
MKRGESLRDELERRYAVGGYFTFPEAVAATVPLIHSLAEHHEEGVALHVHPSSIRFFSGCCSLDLAAAGEPATDDRDRACVAPDLEDGRPGDARSSVFAVGAILYEMVTGETVGASFRPPSEIASEVPRSFDLLIESALVSDGHERPADLRALALALQGAVADAPSPTAEDDDDGIEVDLESSVSQLPPTRKDPAIERARPATVTAGPNASRKPRSERTQPSVAARSGHPNVEAVPAPLVVQAAPTATTARLAPAAASGARGPRGTTERLAELKARLEADTRPRYLVVKDGMDHGPFTAVELLHQIATRHFDGGHALVDSLTKDERPLADWPDFAPFAEQAARSVAVEQERKDLAAQVSADTVKDRRKMLVATGVALVGVAALAGAYFRFGRARNDDVVIRIGQAQNVDFEGGVARGKSGRAMGGGKGGRASGTKEAGGPASAPNAGADSGPGDGPSDGPSDGPGEGRGESGGTIHPVVPDGLSCSGAQARYVEDYSKDAPPDLSAGAYGAVLNRGDYLNACGVPPSMAVSICAAVQNGRAVGVTVSTTPPNGGIARCIAGQVRSLSFPAHPRLDVSTTSFAAQ